MSDLLLNAFAELLRSEGKLPPVEPSPTDKIEAAAHALERAQLTLQQAEDYRATIPYDARSRLALSRYRAAVERVTTAKQGVEAAQAALRQAENNAAGLKAAEFVRAKEEKLKQERAEQLARQPIPPLKEEQAEIDQVRRDLVKRYPDRYNSF